MQEKNVLSNNNIENDKKMENSADLNNNENNYFLLEYQKILGGNNEYMKHFQFHTYGKPYLKKINFNYKELLNEK